MQLQSAESAHPLQPVWHCKAIACHLAVVGNPPCKQSCPNTGATLLNTHARPQGTSRGGATQLRVQAQDLSSHTADISRKQSSTQCSTHTRALRVLNTGLQGQHRCCYTWDSTLKDTAWPLGRPFQGTVPCYQSVNTQPCKTICKNCFSEPEGPDKPHCPPAVEAQAGASFSAAAQLSCTPASHMAARMDACLSSSNCMVKSCACTHTLPHQVVRCSTQGHSCIHAVSRHLTADNQENTLHKTHTGTHTDTHAHTLTIKSAHSISPDTLVAQGYPTLTLCMS